jgi:hypothetical protein
MTTAHQVNAIGMLEQRGHVSPPSGQHITALLFAKSVAEVQLHGFGFTHAVKACASQVLVRAL